MRTVMGLADRLAALERGERPGVQSLAEIEASMHALVQSHGLEASWPNVTGDERDELIGLHDVIERDLRRERDVLLVFGDRRSAQDRLAEQCWATEFACGLDDDTDTTAEGLAHVAAWRARLTGTASA